MLHAGKEATIMKYKAPVLMALIPAINAIHGGSINKTLHIHSDSPHKVFETLPAYMDWE